MRRNGAVCGRQLLSCADGAVYLPGGRLIIHRKLEQAMIYETDLFSFSFVPNWYLQLDALAELALPEPWRFRSGSYSEKNYDTPILERYIQSIFRKQVIDYNAATDMAEKDRIILMRNEYACFHTGLYPCRFLCRCHRL